MPAGLTVQFDDPTGAWGGYDAQLQSSLNAAWQAWTGLFDWTGGSATLHVTFAALGIATAASSGPDGVTPLGQANGMAIEGSSFTRGILGGPTASATLTVGTEWLTRTFPSAADPSPPWQGDDTRVFQHEFMHILGAVTYLNPATGQSPGPWEMAADQYVSFTASGPVDTGPYAQSVVGGPLPLDPVTLVHPLEGGGESVLSYSDPAHSLQPLDIAMLRDDGVPVLFADEMRQHAVIRLLDTLGQNTGRQAPDGATVASDAATLAGGGSLLDLAATLLPSGGGDPAGFVAGLWANAMGAAPIDANDAAAWTGLAADGQLAQVAVDIADSDAHRAALEADPNVAYAASGGTQVALLYDAAFGRAPDPSGYAHWTGLIDAGAIPADVALGMTQSAEFASRYAGMDDASYAGALHAAPDATAAATQGDGTLDRAALLLSAADAPGHVQALAAGASSATVAELGLVPTPWTGVTATA